MSDRATTGQGSRFQMENSYQNNVQTGHAQHPMMKCMRHSSVMKHLDTSQLVDLKQH